MTTTKLNDLGNCAGSHWHGKQLKTGQTVCLECGAMFATRWLTIPSQFLPQHKPCDQSRAH